MVHANFYSYKIMAIIVVSPAVLSVMTHVIKRVKNAVSMETNFVRTYVNLMATSDDVKGPFFKTLVAAEISAWFLSLLFLSLGLCKLLAIILDY